MYPIVSDKMVQFLSRSKLCDLLVTRGLIDVEPCVKASAILSLAYVVTTPQMAKPFMEQRNDQFVSICLSVFLERFCVC